MVPVPDILAVLRQQGFQVSFRDGLLKVSPASRLEDQQRTAIREQKGEIITALRHEPSERAADADPAGGVPCATAYLCPTCNQSHRDWVRLSVQRGRTGYGCRHCLIEWATAYESRARSIGLSVGGINSLPSILPTPTEGA